MNARYQRNVRTLWAEDGGRFDLGSYVSTLIEEIVRKRCRAWFCDIEIELDIR